MKKGAWLALGGAAFELVRRRFVRQWSQVQEAIELQIKRGEAQP